MPLSDLTAAGVFWGIALVSSLVLLVQVAMTLFGLDDLGVDDLDTDGLGLLSFRSVTGFFGGLGWIGLLALRGGWSVPLATLVGSAAGGILMLSVAMLMRFLYSLRESGTLDYKNAIGQIATVYISVPARQQGTGQVRVQVQGRLTVVAAQTRAAESISSQRRVKVVDLVDQRTLLVEPIGSPDAPPVGEGAEADA